LYLIRAVLVKADPLADALPASTAPTEIEFFETFLDARIHFEAELELSRDAHASTGGNT
jgi:hypothetical protein